MGRPLPQSFATEDVELLPTLRVEAMEVTQVVQDLRHSVPLIAGKGTVARIYLSSPSASVTLRGELTVRRTGKPPITVVSLNPPTIAPLPASGVRELRENLRASLNFRLLADLTQAGEVEIALSALTSASGSVVSFTAGPALKVVFINTPPLRVCLLSLRYRAGNPVKTHEPREIDFQHALSWLRRAYPVAEVIFTRATVDINAPWPFRCEVANAFLAELRQLDMSAGADARTHYFGMVADSGGKMMRGCAAWVPGHHPAPECVASGPSGARTWEWDFDGSYADWYTGHELAHTFGRFHPGFCDSSDDDPHFPFPNGQISGDDSAYVGFDIGDEALGLPMMALPGTAWHDVMTYCVNQWMCSYTYDGIRRRLLAENPGFDTGGARAESDVFETAALPEATQRLIHVVALLDLETLSGRLRSVKPVARGIPTPPEEKSDAVIEVLGPNGVLLYSQPVLIKQSTCCEGEDLHGMIDALIAAPEGARQVVLKLRGAVADGFPPVAGASTAESASAEAAAPAPATTVWQRYQQASADGGQTWQTIASGASAQESAPVLNPFPGTAYVIVRTFETNGFVSNLVDTVNLHFVD